MAIESVLRLEDDRTILLAAAAVIYYWTFVLFAQSRDDSHLFSLYCPVLPINLPSSLARNKFNSRTVTWNNCFPSCSL